MADFLFRFILLALFAIAVLCVVWYSYYMDVFYERNEEWKKESRAKADRAMREAEAEWELQKSIIKSNRSR